MEFSRNLLPALAQSWFELAGEVEILRRLEKETMNIVRLLDKEDAHD